MLIRNLFYLSVLLMGLISTPAASLSFGIYTQFKPLDIAGQVPIHFNNTNRSKNLKISVAGEYSRYSFSVKPSDATKQGMTVVLHPNVVKQGASFLMTVQLGSKIITSRFKADLPIPIKHRSSTLVIRAVPKLITTPEQVTNSAPTNQGHIKQQPTQSHITWKPKVSTVTVNDVFDLLGQNDE